MGVDIIKNWRFLSTPSARRATCLPAGRFRQWEQFLSTPSARRATTVSLHFAVTAKNFYPRPPRGGRPFPHRRQDRDGQISIHALREEGDVGCRTTTKARRNFYPRPPRGGRRRAQPMRAAPRQFLSTPSARRATIGDVLELCVVGISIHALREEGDSKNRDKISIFKQIIQHSARI